MHAMIVVVAMLPDVAAYALASGLDAPTFAARESASARLVAAGERLLPAVRRLLAGPLSAEARGRLVVAADRLELEMITEPRRVTLSVRGAPLADVLAEMGRQTGHALRAGEPRQSDGPPRGGPRTKVSVQLAAVPFLQALDAIGDANALSLSAELDPWSGATEVTDRDTDFYPVKGYAGRFRCLLTDLAWSGGMRLDRPRGAGFERRSTAITFGFVLTAEPGGRLLPLSAARVVRAVDDAGKPVAISPGGSDLGGGLKTPGSMSYRAGSVAFCREDSRATSLRELELAIKVAVPVEERVVARVPDLRHAGGQTRGRQHDADLRSGGRRAVHELQRSGV